MSVHRNKGFTLIEMMVTVAILAILAALVTPAMQTTMANSRVRSATSDVASVLADARAQAIGRQRSLTLKAIDGDWSKGWTLALTVPITGVDDLAAHRGLPESIVVTPNPDLDELVFQPNGMVQTDAGAYINTVVFQVCDSKSGTETGRNVTVTRLGRATTQSHADATVCN